MLDAPGLLLKRAFDHAALWHAGQLRKYPNAKVPYLSHPAGVVGTLARHGFDEPVLAAGALHDVIEDTDASFDDLRDLFGLRVAELVRHVSEEDKSLPWEARKQAYLDHFPDKPWEAQAITLADKIDNLRSVVVCAAEFGNPWSTLKRGREVQIQRFDALLLAARALPGHALVDEYAEAIALVRRVADDGTLTPAAGPSD